MNGRRTDTKSELRNRFRALRRGLDHRPQRSAQIWEFVTSLGAYSTATSVMLFDSVPGEPETANWKRDAVQSGRDVYVPELPELPRHVDVVVVPGLAFTPSGARLGQGGGWYDRFLAQVSAGATVGVCFHEQLVDDLPVEAHDIAMTVVVTERGICEVN